MNRRCVISNILLLVGEWGKAVKTRQRKKNNFHTIVRGGDATSQLKRRGLVKTNLHLHLATSPKVLK